MRVVRDFSQVPAFQVIEPIEPTLPFVYNSPHSGAHYPRDFLAQARLDARRIRRSEDAFVDEIFAAAPSLGASLVRVNFPRAYLDVNREPYELDPKMFDGRLPAYANIRSLRVAGGLGTIARIVAENEEIYRGPLAVEEGLMRVETLYKPYHATLAAQLEATRRRFGHAVLVDCHSMPSALKLPDLPARLDVVVGDRYGTSADGALVEAAVDLLEGLGLTVARNKPYAGGFITEHYGRPQTAIHALQIEINRGLYMDEVTHARLPGHGVLVGMMTDFISDFADAARGILGPWALAAE